MAVSAMARIYYAQVKSGKRRIDQVPALWRDEVQQLIDAEGE